MGNKPNKWLSLVSIPFQMGAVIFLMNRLGMYLDERNHSENYTKWLTLLGVFLSIYHVIKQVLLLNKEDNDKK